VAGRHTQPSHPPLLRSLNQEALPADGSRYYEGEAARWYSTVYAWKNDDIPFYLAQAERWAGPGGAVLELACGNGRVALPMARAGYRVAAVDTSEAMLEQLAQRLSEEPEPVRERVQPLRQDMRRLKLDRLFRFIYLPFNTMLVLLQPHDRQAMLDRVREHLAPSGAFAFDIFTPDPARLVDDDWSTDLEVEADDPGGDGRVHVRRDCRRKMDETLTRPELLDRFIWYCFDAAEPDAASAQALALVADRDALRAAVVERLKETSAMPDQIRHAHEIAAAKL